jgi:DnaJ-class molecular chaperone
MKPEQLKHEIRRRLYAARRAARQDPGELAALFMTCPRCAGRGQICEEFLRDDVPCALLDVCPKCNGAKFVDKPYEVNDSGTS